MKLSLLRSRHILVLPADCEEKKTTREQITDFIFSRAQRIAGMNNKTNRSFFHFAVHRFENVFEEKRARVFAIVEVAVIKVLEGFVNANIRQNFSEVLDVFLGDDLVAGAYVDVCRSCYLRQIVIWGRRRVVEFHVLDLLVVVLTEASAPEKLEIMIQLLYAGRMRHVAEDSWQDLLVQLQSFFV